uniref:Single domain-containing protein n=1 Tax=Amblyomma maculatum TaxID=34609 RepID=G3MTT5_AMBMU
MTRKTMSKGFRGDCTYNGTMIKNGETFQPSGLCEQFLCTNGDVMLQTCTTKPVYEGCEQHPGPGSVYPDCCPSVYCP